MATSEEAIDTDATKLSSEVETRKRATLDEEGAEKREQQATAKKVKPDTKENTVNDEEEEEGEIVETISFRERADKVWTLDLNKPPRERIVKSPLLHAVTRGRPLPGGLWLEFGVFSGQTINLMASHAPDGTVVYGFDTFTGLPEAWRNKFEKGMFDRKGNLPKVESNVSLVKGLFQNTLEGFLRRPEVKSKTYVSVCHLDADLYSSTIYVLRTLANRIVPGSILVFDELVNYPEFREHEWLALLECVEEYGWEFEWLSQAAIMEEKPVLDVWDTQQVAIRITAVRDVK